MELDSGGVVIAELDEKMLAAGLRSGMRVNVTLETVLDTKSDGEQGGNATLPTTLAPGDQKVVSILPLEADAPDDSRSTGARGRGGRGALTGAGTPWQPAHGQPWLPCWRTSRSNPSPPRRRPARLPAAGRKMNVTIAGVGAASLKVTSYVPLQKSVRTLVIPILARNYKGERCPGVEPRTYSLQVGVQGPTGVATMPVQPGSLFVLALELVRQLVVFPASPLTFILRSSSSGRVMFV